MAQKEKKGGSLGNLITAPFKLANLPFKTYRQLYGKPRYDDSYTGTPIQKARLKKIMRILFNCGELNKNDSHFLDMVNDFLTQEGNQPIDHSRGRLKEKCKDKNIDKYFYISLNGKTSKTYQVDDTDDEEEEETEEKQKKYRYAFSFNKELDPEVRSKKKFQKGGSSYNLTLLGTKKVNGKNGLMFTNEWFKKDEEYLILTTSGKNFFNELKDFNVYKNNFKNPLKEPIFLGQYPIKITQY